MDEIVNRKLVGSINGVIVGNAGLVTGKVGLALYTNGIDQYVNLGNQGDTCLGYFILCSHGWVTAFWVKLGSLPGTHAIIDTGVNANKGMGIALFNGYLGAQFRSNTTHWTAGDFWGTPLQDWMHVVATWKPSYGATLYVNGEMIATDDAPQVFNVVSANDEPLFIIGYSPYYNSKLEMTLDELRVWDTVMDDEDVLALYNGDTGLD